MMQRTLPPLEDVLGKLPWFGDLTDAHRRELVDVVQERLALNTPREEYIALLERWADVAHVDGKWARFARMREGGLLGPAA